MLDSEIGPFIIFMEISQTTGFIHLTLERFFISKTMQKYQDFLKIFKEDI